MFKKYYYSAACTSLISIPNLNRSTKRKAENNDNLQLGFVYRKTVAERDNVFLYATSLSEKLLKN